MVIFKPLPARIPLPGLTDEILSLSKSALLNKFKGFLVTIALIESILAGGETFRSMSSGGKRKGSSALI